MRKLKGLLLLLISVMVLNGCSVPQYINYDNIVRESKGEDFFVKIYNESELVDLEYEVIGEVVIQGTEVVEVLLERLRDKVKEVGGDGLIEFSVNGFITSGVYNIGDYVYSVPEDGLILGGKVIVIIEE